MEQLRGKGVFNLADVEFAILETDGNLSIQRKSQTEAVTPRDLGISTRYTGIPTVVVQEGRILRQNLIQLHLDEEWLKVEQGRVNLFCSNQMEFPDKHSNSASLKTAGWHAPAR